MTSVLDNTTLPVNDTSLSSVGDAAVLGRTMEGPALSVDTLSVGSQQSCTFQSMSTAEDLDPSVTEGDSDKKSLQETITAGAPLMHSLPGSVLTKEAPSFFASPDTVFSHDAAVPWGKRFFQSRKDAEWRARFHGWKFQRMVDRLIAAKAELDVLYARKQKSDGLMYSDLGFSQAMCRGLKHEIARLTRERETDVSLQGPLEVTTRQLGVWEADYQRLAKAQRDLELERDYLMKFTAEMEKKAKREMKKGRGV